MVDASLRASIDARPAIQALKELTAAFQQGIKATQDFGQKLDTSTTKGATAAVRASRSIRQMGEEMVRNASAQDRLATSALRAQNQMERLRREAERLSSVKSPFFSDNSAQMIRMQRAFDGYLASVNKGPAATRSLAAETERLNVSLGSLSRLALNTAVSIQGMFAAFAIREIVQANIAFEKLLFGLQAVTGTSAEARKEFAFVAQVSDQLGISLEGAGKGYTRMLAAAQNTAFTTTDIRKIFIGMSEASRTLGLSADDLQGIFRALEQSISKNRLMAEELRLQLGDRLPGAAQAMAKALGVSSAELDKMMKKGEITGEVLRKGLVAFADEYSRRVAPGMAAATKGMQAEIQRLSNELLFAARAFGEAGFNKAITDAARGLREFLQSAAGHSILQTLGAAIALVAGNFDLLAAVMAGVLARSLVMTAATIGTSLITQLTLLSQTLVAVIGGRAAIAGGLTGFAGALGLVGTALGGWPTLVAAAAAGLFLLATRESEAAEAARLHKDVMFNAKGIMDELATASGNRATQLVADRQRLLDKAEAEVIAAQAAVEHARAMKEATESAPEIGFGIGAADLTGAMQRLGDVTKRIRELRSALYGGQTVGPDKMPGKDQDLSDKLKASADKAQEFLLKINPVMKALKDYADNEKKLNDLRDKGLITDQQYRESLEQITKARDAATGATKAAKEALKEHNKELKEHEKALKDETKLQEAYGKVLDDQSDSFEKYLGHLNDIQTAIKTSRDENEILRLKAQGYDDTSEAVINLKRAQEEAKIAADEYQKILSLDAKAADLLQKADEAMANAMLADALKLDKAVGDAWVNIALRRKDIADEIRQTQIPSLEQLFKDYQQQRGQRSALEAQDKVSQEAAKNFEKFMDRAVDNVADVFRMAFEGNIQGIGETLKRVLLGALADVLAEGVRPLLRQLTAPLFGLSLGPTGNAYMPTGGAGGGLFGSNVFGGGNLLGGVDRLAAQYLPGVFQSASPLATTAAQYGVNIADVGGLPTGSTFPFSASTALGYGVAGIGGALPGLMSGNYAQTGLGAAGGAAGFYFGGPPGALIGATIGNLIGGLFGSKPKTPAAGALLDVSTGSLETASKVMSADDVTKIARQLLPSVQQSISRYGVDLAPGTRFGVGYSEPAGYDVKLVGPGAGAYLKQFAVDKDNPAEALADITLAMIQMADAVANADVKAAAASLTFDDTAEAIGRVLDGAAGFRDALAIMNEHLNPVTAQITAINASAKELAAGFLTQIKDFKDVAERIGGDAVPKANEALRAMLDGVLGLVEMKPGLTETQAAIEQAKANFQALQPALEELGYSAADAAGKIAQATEAMLERTRAEFERGFKLAANPELGTFDQAIAAYRGNQQTAGSLYDTVAGLSSIGATINEDFARQVSSALSGIKDDAGKLGSVVLEFGLRADDASQYISKAATAMLQMAQAGEQAAQQIAAANYSINRDAGIAALTQTGNQADRIGGALASFQALAGMIDSTSLAAIQNGGGAIASAMGTQYEGIKGVLAAVSRLPPNLDELIAANRAANANLAKPPAAATRPGRDYYGDLAGRIGDSRSGIAAQPANDLAAAAASTASNVVPFPRTFTPLDQPFLTVASRSLNDLTQRREAQQIGVDITQGMTRIATSFSQVGERQVTRLDTLIQEVRGLREAVERRNHQPIVAPQQRGTGTR